jgi:hypothetical protein
LPLEQLGSTDISWLKRIIELKHSLNSNTTPSSTPSRRPEGVYIINLIENSYYKVRSESVAGGEDEKVLEGVPLDARAAKLHAT